MALVDPNVFGFQVQVLWRFPFWCFNGIFVVAVWYLQFRLFERALRHRNIAVPSALMVGVAVALLLHMNYAIASILTGDPDFWRGRLYPDVLRYFLVGVFFEAASAALLMPRLLITLRRRAQSAEKPGGSSAPAEPEISPALTRSIEANGRHFDLGNVLYLKSAEHYVEIVLHDATELVRASLRELTAMLDPCQGVQPHRSYWVSRDAIVGLNRCDGAQFLVLRDGSEIPVSRSRRGEVRNWLSTHVQ
ncbi:LytTR family DNA-binding domain-containing protein [Marimonas lutisalis]|uniref:LytTR family DNA-binding domain-containing protein n=1 Tax=Marimonas lutisalis TaxID=2545756 RepID=UPI0013763970|nr:LytTR family DNA-binding domain-containing protein [Marimonas lutisalis]